MYPDISWNGCMAEFYHMQRGSLCQYNVIGWDKPKKKVHRIVLRMLLSRYLLIQYIALLQCKYLQFYFLHSKESRGDTSYMPVPSGPALPPLIQLFAQTLKLCWLCESWCSSSLWFSTTVNRFYFDFSCTWNTMNDTTSWNNALPHSTFYTQLKVSNLASDA